MERCVRLWEVKPLESKEVLRVQVWTDSGSHAHAHRRLRKAAATPSSSLCHTVVDSGYWETHGKKLGSYSVRWVSPWLFAHVTFIKYPNQNQKLADAEQASEKSHGQ